MPSFRAVHLPIATTRIQLVHALQIHSAINQDTQLLAASQGLAIIPARLVQLALLAALAINQDIQYIAANQVLVNTLQVVVKMHFAPAILIVIIQE